MKTVVIIAMSLFVVSAQAKPFVYCSEASPKIFNPQLATDGASFNASSRTVYNKLVDFKTGGTVLVPSLATQWKISKDGLKYTFNLRKNVAFHESKLFKPTRSFNADDVLFTFNRMRLKSHPYHKVNGGSYKYFRSMNMGKLIKDIKKINDHKVQFVLNHPEAPFLANLAMDFASILSKEYGDVLIKKKKKAQIDLKPIGTGPFVFKKYVKDSVIRFNAFDKYFSGPAKIKKLIFSITPDPSVRFQKLKKGECHLIAEPSPVDLPQMKKNANIVVKAKPGLNVGYLAMNTEKAPLNKPLVRKAIYHALNRPSYLKAIYKGNAEVAKTPVPPTVWSHHKGIKDYGYNPQKAKSLLKQAGYPQGFKIKLWTLPVSRPYNPNGKKMGEMMQSDLSKVGIKVDLVTYKWATYLDKSSRGEHELIQLGWTSDNGDPDNFLNVLLGCDSVKGGSNMARWCDKSFNSLVSRAKRTSNKAQRIQFYKKAQNVFHQKTPWVPLAHAQTFRAFRKNVKNYKISPFGVENFYGVSIN